MSDFGRLFRRLRAIIFRRRLERDLDDEVQFHLAMQAAQHAKQGTALTAARARATREFGGIERYKDEMRDARGLTLADDLARDFRFAGRTLRRSPAFTTIAVLTLALGIGATTAIFTVVNGVLLRPLPYPEPDRIMQVWASATKSGRGMQFSDPDFEDLRDQTRSFAAVAEVSDWGVTSVAGAGEPVRANLALVSKEFFRVMGVAPMRGRLFVPEEQREGGRPAVLVSEGFWRHFLGGAPLGPNTTLTFENRVFTVVGVLPATLDYPTGTELWTPRELIGRSPSRTAHNFQVVGRLAPGVSLDQARAEVRAVAHRLKQQYGSQTDMTDITLVPLRDQLVGQAKPALLAILGASAFLLLIACANVVNLMMARAAAREGEYALRLALGATRVRLVQQFVAEAMVLALGGGVLGVMLAGGGIRALLTFQPGNLPRVSDIQVNWAVCLFALGIALVAAIVMGCLTAWRTGHGDLRDALAESQRTQAGAGGTNRIRRALVTAQVAATLVLLVGAGLLGRSFVKLLSIDPGFRADHALVLDLSLPAASGQAALRQRAIFFDNVIARLRTIPGVRDVGAVNDFPLTVTGPDNGTFIILTSRDEVRDTAAAQALWDGVAHNPSRTGNAELRIASADYFRVMNIPLIRGRGFDDRDAPDGPDVAVISQSLAKERWPNEDPIGKLIEYGNMDGDLRPLTIVGIVGDVRDRDLAAPPRPTFYEDYRQRPSRMASSYIVIQGPNVETPAVIAAARRAVHELRPDVPPRFRTIESIVSSSVADKRFTLLLISVFGASALLLATLGVYGVISYIVTQRRQEISVRIALGAQTGDVVGLVLREGAVLAIAGVFAGIIGAVAVTRLIAGLLYGVSTTDPVSFAAVSIGLIGIVLLASFLPAQRATRIDPMRILRGG